MPTSKPVQSNWTAGEFDPALFARSDTTFYANAAEILENVVIQPQGGATVRPGSPAIGRQRGSLQAITIDTSMITSTNASDEANLVDDDTATVMLTGPGLNDTAGYQVWVVDFGAPVSSPVVAIDCIDNKLTTDDTAEFAIEASPDGANWSLVGVVDVRGEASSRRIAAHPGANLGSFQFWRMVRQDAEDLGATRVQLSDVRFWSEGDQADARLFPVTTDADTEFLLSVTERNIDIYRSETLAYVASVGAKYLEADLLKVTSAQSRDLVVMFERNYPQHRVFRQGQDDRWDFSNLEFESVAEFPWGDEFVTGGENEVQTLVMTAVAADEFKFELNTEFSDAVVVSGVDTTDRARIEAALNGMDQISEVSVTVTGSQTFDIEFTGDDANTPKQLMIAVSVVGSGSYNVRRTNRGEEPTAPLWDDDHGFPSCGTFYQGRFFQGGFRDRRDAVSASRAGSFFETELDEEPSSDSPLLFSADTDEQTEINAMHAGRHLQIFTTSGEFFVPSEPITTENIALKQTTRIGSVVGLPTFDVEGATLFVGKNGRSIHEYIFVDTEQSYQANLISLLASHLVAEPSAIAFRRRVAGNDGDLYLIANRGLDNDGARVPFAIATVLRSQQVTAFTRATTPNGAFEGVTATQGGKIFVIAEREVNGVTARYIEAWSSDHMLDGGAIYENPSVSTHTADGIASIFAWDFASPSDEADIAVYTRASGGTIWGLVDHSEYTANISIGRVEFVTAPVSGTEVRLSKRITSVALTDVTAHLDGAMLDVLIDGFPVPTLTAAGGAIALGDHVAHFSVEYGFEFVVRVRTLAFRPELRDGLWFGKKMRVPYTVATINRMGGFSLGMVGHPKQQSTGNLVGALSDRTAEETLRSGSVRFHGLKGWSEAVQIEVVRDEATPFTLLGLNYTLRF